MLRYFKLNEFMFNTCIMLCSQANNGKSSWCLHIFKIYN